VQIWNAVKKAYEVKKKDYGKSLKNTDIPEALKFIFSNGRELRKDVIKFFLDQLRVLLKWFEEQRSLRFYSSSLLFVYEGLISSSQNTEIRITNKRIE
jgi:inositol-hexakisphosphate kinase